MDFIDKNIVLAMDITIINALIGVSAVVLSIIINYFTNRKSIRNEILKITSDIEQNFTKPLLTERNTRYPEIYFHLSQLARDLEMMGKEYESVRQKVTRKSIQELIVTLETIDSKHGIFFSINTAYAFADLRKELYEIHKVLGPDEVLPNRLVESLRTYVSLAEIGLKKDVGIHIDEHQEIRKKYTAKDYIDLRSIE